ncbi:integrating conjugative element protein, PFL_4705 family [Azotobacter vinelandii]|nr:integrating conjugative element protein, PFL_4705 family [Azotobacter vinelandii]
MNDIPSAQDLFRRALFGLVALSGGTTSSSGNSALNNILSGGVSDIREWVNKLYGEAFAAVYVQPGAKVAVHLTQQLAIDYELKGRKVDFNAGASHVSAHLD